MKPVSPGAAEETERAPETDIAAEDAAENFAIAQVELGHEHTLTFYERAPGVVLMAESAISASQQKSTMQLAGASNPIQVFEHALPNSPIPPLLLEAWERAQALSARSVGAGGGGIARANSGGGWPQVLNGPAAVHSPDGLGTTQQAHSSSNAADFINTHTYCDWSNSAKFSVNVCRISWGGGFFSQATSAGSILYLDHYAGDGVTLRLTLPSGVTNWNYPAGVSLAQQSLNCSTYCRWDVLNAAGDSFHVRAVFY